MHKNILTNTENIFRDPDSKSLLITDDAERTKIKQQRKLVDRIYSLENSIIEINKKIDAILTILGRCNEPRTY